MSSPLTRFALAALASTALAVTAAPAFAGGQPGQTVTIDSTIILRQHFPAFHGRVKADNDACIEQRTVKLFKLRRRGDRKLLGTTTTDNAGKWQVNVEPLKSGAYFAVVKKETQGTAGTIYVCARDKSKIAPVD